jgi:hypothetical protein
MHPDERRERSPEAHRTPGRSRYRRLTVAVIAVAALLQLAGAVAHAAASSSASPSPAPTYQATDLVAVAQGGVQGYCSWGELQGPPPIPGGHLRLIQYTCERGYGIPIYEADGVTRIGAFEIGGPGGGGGGSFADGSRHEETADAHGTIIDTRKSASGSITIVRTELRGATTTNAAADDPSLTRIPNAERPVTWRAITLWFHGTGPKHPELTSARPKAPAWLVDRMSAAARAAGDSGAVARWTLTFRRCAAPLEGSATPKSDRGKYKIVWIAVLRGSFTHGDWSYLILDRGTHDVISRGVSEAPFDTAMFRLQGRTQLH